MRLLILLKMVASPSVIVSEHVNVIRTSRAICFVEAKSTEEAKSCISSVVSMTRTERPGAIHMCTPVIFLNSHIASLSLSPSFSNPPRTEYHIGSTESVLNVFLYRIERIFFSFLLVFLLLDFFNLLQEIFAF